jgi:hypothetical protein
MITSTQHTYTKEKGWQQIPGAAVVTSPQLVFMFGSTEVVSNKEIFDHVKGMYPQAHILSASTAGEIVGTTVQDNSAVVTALQFNSTKVITASAHIDSAEQSKDLARSLAQQLPLEGLRHVLAFTDGLSVNGTSLTAGIAEVLPKSVTTTGGLAGDGAAFKMTVVGIDAPATAGTVVLIGLYGEALTVGYGSLGGWDPFGPDRMITKSKNNVLLELDGEPALSLYKKYLGDKASELPGSGLLFPLELTLKHEDGTTEKLVRTLLAVDEAAQSMTFAGDMPEGVPARMMRANFDRLIEGADGAAKKGIQGTQAQFALLVSCVGRKLVLGDRIEEEVEAVSSAVGNTVPLAGFYSYGELCPTTDSSGKVGICQLHNQTMTITIFNEA